MDKHAILAVKKKPNLVFFCEKYIKETLSGQFVCKTTSFRLFFCEKYIKETLSGQFVCKTTSFRLFFDYNYATQMRHAAFFDFAAIFDFV